MPMRVYDSTWMDKSGKPRFSTVYIGNVDEDKSDEDVAKDYALHHPEMADLNLVRQGTDNRTPKEVIEQGPRL